MKHQVGNILQEVTKGFILHQVNCQGVMGSGIARSIRDKWRVVYDQYLNEVDEQGKLQILGWAQVVQVSDTPLFVVNLFGQFGYGTDRQHTNYEALGSALMTFERLRSGLNVQYPDLEVHHPLIGCGLGGGKWETVRSLIEKHISVETTLWELPK
jgi:O-acetyl-ADP-ribose deacetylase (regulator of RNase III)